MMMKMRRNLRMALALLAAYALALQAVLLAASPLAGGLGAADQPICRTLAAADGAPSAPAGPRHDCLAACLAMGCGTADVTIARIGSAADYPPATMRTVAFAPDVARAPHSLVAYSHYSRAPPRG